MIQTKLPRSHFKLWLTDKSSDVDVGWVEQGETQRQSGCCWVTLALTQPTKKSGFREFCQSVSFNPVVAITWVLVSLIGYPAPLLAQPYGSSNRSSEQLQIHFVQANQDPPDRGTPPAPEGTGSRGDCQYKQESPPLTRLVGSQHLQLTVREHPTFWVYVPYTSEEAPSGEFSLQDGDDDVYRTRFQLPATPGIVSITLPATTKPLEVGKEYRWYFDINCPHSASSNDNTPASVTGLIQRIIPSESLERELKAAKTPLERIATYAKHGIWYETLTELAQMRLNEPKNPTVKSAWIDLLSESTIGLDNVAQEPIIGSVTTIR